MLIINESGVVGGCYLGSAFAARCRQVVIRIAAYKTQISNRKTARSNCSNPFPSTADLQAANSQIKFLK